MITVKTNKDLYITNDTTIPEFTDRITDIIVPSGTEFNVVDILIDREGEAFGNSHTAFLCDNAEYNITDYIALEDIEDKCWQIKSRF